MAANGVLNEVWTTSRARLGMRGSIEVRFPDFRESLGEFEKASTRLSIKRLDYELEIL